MGHLGWVIDAIHALRDLPLSADKREHEAVGFQVQVPKDVHKQIRWQRCDAGCQDLIRKVLCQARGQRLPFSRPSGTTQAVRCGAFSQPYVPADGGQLQVSACMGRQCSTAVDRWSCTDRQVESLCILQPAQAVCSYVAGLEWFLPKV